MAKSGSAMMCLRCKLQIKTLKRSNAKQHYDNCKALVKYIGLQGEDRKEVHNIMNSNHTKETSMFSNFKSTSYNPHVEASYRVAFKLGTAGKPYADVDLFREFLLEVVQCLEPSQLHKYKALPISRRTIVRRQEELAVDLVHQLNVVCKQPDALFSIALDESCDATDSAQLLIFIRTTTSCFDMHEELLSLVSMKSTTRATDILEVFNKTCEEKKIDLRKLVSVCTDGAPAMAGISGGFVALLKKQLRSEWPDSPSITSFHCIIHQEALCAKSATLDETMEEAISIVNFIRARALNHRQFRQILQNDDSTEKREILFHTNVRWLSKGAVIKRIYEFQDVIKEFYASKGIECKLSHATYFLKLAFLGDILGHLNDFNLQLQGKNQNVCELWRFVKVIVRKLKLFQNKFVKKELTQSFFPLLYDCSMKHPNEEVSFSEFSEVFISLIAEFENRFSEFRALDDDLRLVSEPHLLEPETMSDVYQIELLDLSEDTVSRHTLSQPSVDLVAFWCGSL